MYVKPKKNLGQHFLTSEKIAQQIADSIDYPVEEGKKAGCIEIGPGTGILTKYLMQNPKLDLSVIEIDNESVEFLVANYPSLSIEHRIVSGDFLRIDLCKQFPGGFHSAFLNIESIYPSGRADCLTKELRIMTVAHCRINYGITGLHGPHQDIPGQKPC